MLDSIPMVAITGQVASPLLGSDAFQEVDITGVTLPITKHNALVTRADELARTIREDNGKSGLTSLGLLFAASVSLASDSPAIFAMPEDVSQRTECVPGERSFSETGVMPRDRGRRRSRV